MVMLEFLWVEKTQEDNMVVVIHKGLVEREFRIIILNPIKKRP